MSYRARLRYEDAFSLGGLAGGPRAPCGMKVCYQLGLDLLYASRALIVPEGHAHWQADVKRNDIFTHCRRGASLRKPGGLRHGCHPDQPHRCLQTRPGTPTRGPTGQEARGGAPATPSIDPEPECGSAAACGGAGQRELARASALAKATPAVMAGGR